MWKEVIISPSGIWIRSGTAYICLLTHGALVVRKFPVVPELMQAKCFELITGVK